jgi:hypothetical protein
LLHDHGCSHHDRRADDDARSHDHTQALHHHRLSPVGTRADQIVDAAGLS